MQWLKKFMYGRYGTDQLNMALLITSIVLMMAVSFVHPTGWWTVLTLIPLVPLGWAFFRMLSRKVYVRSYENTRFMKLVQPVAGWFKWTATRIRGGKTHKFFKCAQCGKTMRVPRGKGHIQVTCPGCGNKFKAKT